MKKNVYEILDEFVRAKGKHDKLCVLRFNNSFTLECVLRGAFDPRIEYLIKRPVEYKSENVPAGYSYNNMTQALKQAYLFEANNPKRNPALTEERMKILLIQILEGLEPKEAVVYQNMLLKNLHVPDLTYELVKEAFPNLLP